MLVDDNTIDLMINAKIINSTKLCKELITFSAARQAIEFISDHLNTPEKLPDIIMLDLQMPEMDGFAFLQKYAGFPNWFKSACPVVVLTSSDDFGDVSKAVANINVTKLLKKPLSIKDFRETIKELYF